MITKNIRLGSTELKLILTLEEERSIFTTADSYRMMKYYDRQKRAKKMAA